MQGSKTTVPQVDKKSRLPVVGLVLDFIIPPVGLIISIVALSKIKNNPLDKKTVPIIGVVLGALFSTMYVIAVAFLIFLYIILGGGNNQAQTSFQPMAAQIEAAGGQELCKNGDNGKGIDNRTPWFEVYYKIPDSKDLASKMTAIASNYGYHLAPSEFITEQLRLYPDGGGADPPYNHESDYLSTNTQGESLDVTINRKTSVPLYCEGSVKDYGREVVADGTTAILDVRLTAKDNN